MKKQSISTFLPIFNGFYNTIFDSTSQIDNEVYSINQERREKRLDNIDYEALKIDNTSYENEVSKELCYILENELENFVTKIVYEKLISPKTYNFSNDSIDVVIEPKTKAIKKYIYEYKEKFIQYLKNNYTSYDGFFSHFSNDFDTWKNDTNNFTNFSKNGHILGSILQFIALNEGITEFNLYDRLEVHISSYIENYDLLVSNPSCNKCNSIIEDINIIKDKEKYFKLTNKNCTVFCTSCLEKLIYA